MSWQRKKQNENITAIPLSEFEQRKREMIRLISHDEEALIDRRNRWMVVADLVFIHGFSAKEIFEIVDTDSEQRFELSDDLTEIRLRRRLRRPRRTRNNV